MVMAFEFDSGGSRTQDFARLGDRHYWLTPATDEETSLPRTHVQHAELQRYHSDELKDVKAFKYDPLPSDKKRIRLLELIPGTAEGREIYCKLIEVDYDETFHIPMKIGSNEKRKRKRTPDSVDGDNDEVIDPMLAEYSSSDEKDAEKKAKWDQFKKTKVEKWKQHTKTLKETKEQREDQVDAEFAEHWKLVSKAQIPYEALSWSWGDDTPIYAVHIIKDGEPKPFKQLVKRELALALKYLRQAHQPRTLWIDAICINQYDIEERNHQVQMMSRIYSRATQACIWLGEDKPSTKVAFDFIREDIMNLKNFDKICSDRRYNPKWQALMELMQADWFFRRWVVQEIALSSEATVYCGPNSIPWKDFAVAVELFVEVETATHRLSEIMQNDEKFRHVPGWFEHVSELGASLLVQATGKVFRTHTKTPAEKTKENGSKEEEEEEDELRGGIDDVRTIDPLQRRSLLSLEYLVSTMFIFKATEPRDVVYALLAVARDATPLADATLRYDDKTSLVLTLLNSFLEEKPFLVDYRRPYTDVCRDFVQFIIRRKHKLDPIQALDILCRPWALEPVTGRSIRLKKEAEVVKKQIMSPRKKKWQKRQSKIIETKDKNEKVTYKIEKDKNDERTQDDRTPKEYGQQIQSVTELPVFADQPDGKMWKKPENWGRIEKECDDYKIRKDEASKQRKMRKIDEQETEQDMELPSWVSRASQAPFSLYHHPGMHILKTGRAHADALVGQPADGHRNYSAAQTRGLDLDILRFRKRPALGHYSLMVKGFELDGVTEVRDASQGGNIPKSWLTMAGWKEPFDSDPPDPLWRTLVADRGRDNKNPPYYYARACRESVHKGGVMSGSVNTTALINNEQNSIVAEFCRRVHAVIWNRSMFKTTDGQLGLASNVEKGDKVCILYGCTVPVILRKFKKNAGDCEKEDLEDQMEALKSCIRRMETNRARRARNRLNKEKYMKSGEWFQMMDDRKKAEENLRKLAAQDSKKPEPNNEKSQDDTEFVPGPLTRAKTSYQLKREKAKKDDPEHYYKFIGECYVHGMMDGEAMRTRFYDGEPDRGVEIR